MYENKCVYDDTKPWVFDNVCLPSFPNTDGVICFTDNRKYLGLV